MGFYFRKSFGKGPFRTTISNRGISASIGGKYGRVGYYASHKKRSNKNNKNKNQENYNEIIEPFHALESVFYLRSLLFLGVLLFPFSLLLCLIPETRLFGILGIVLSIVLFVIHKINIKKAKKIREERKNK